MSCPIENQSKKNKRSRSSKIDRLVWPTRRCMDSYNLNFLPSSRWRSASRERKIMRNFHCMWVPQREPILGNCSAAVVACECRLHINPRVESRPTCHVAYNREPAMDFHCTKGRERERVEETGEESLLSSYKIQHPAVSHHLPRSAPMATAVRHRGRMLTEEERRVAEILLELPMLLEPFRSLSNISWGRKRRRSSFPAVLFPSSSDERPHSKVEAASPATPLSFSPSDADEDSRPKISSRRDSKKKSHEELKEEVARLSAEQIQLQHECTKRREYRDELQTLNLRLSSQLKEKQSQLFLQACCQPHLSQCRSFDLTGNVTAGAFPGNKYPNISHLVVRLTSADCRTEDTAGVPSSDGQTSLAWTSSGSALENHGMPVGILDLNAPPKEAFSLDFIQNPIQFNNKAAIASEARKRRMEINRVRNCLALKQSRLR